MSNLLTAAELRNLIERWMADGKRVAGPRQISAADGSCSDKRVQYGWLESAEQMLLNGFLRPANSIKEFVFPRHEALYDYRFIGKQIEVLSRPAPEVGQIIVGARPCDAAALPILDRVFNWDSRDESYNRRRQLTTIVTFACHKHDAHCFCTSVGSGPADTRGSDAVLVEAHSAVYEVRCLTDKGRALFNGHTITSGEQGRIADGPPKHFELADLSTFLAGGYERPEWQSVTRRCLGCGACAYTCPTCHCFDIVDEPGRSGGTRVRNWDACQFAMFTVHASGHNPRGAQSQRQRQRIHHKFQIYPDKFGDVLCTGCGNCTRNCPVSLGVLPVLKSLTAKTCPPTSTNPT